MDDHNGVSKITYHFSVRSLVGYVYRHGGMAESYPNETEQTGQTLHRRFIRAFMDQHPKWNILSEYSLSSLHEEHSVQFHIKGRADMICDQPDHIEVIEMKSLFSPPSSFPDHADILHVAQARIYAYMYAASDSINQSKPLQVTVAYIQPNTFQVKYFREHTSFDALYRFFTDTCMDLSYLLQDVAKYQQMRDQSITSLSFPYNNLRDGQKDFMRNVLTSVRNHEFSMITAPTGIGKTISVLFPCIKAIPFRYSHYIFYLTGKTSTQEAALNALSDLRERGLVLKSIHITAKEKICLQQDLYCDMEVCPYATSYYENSKKAIRELLHFTSIDRAVLQSVARKYKVCPFEIGLDMALFCDVIICDYNYIFDPRVALIRFVAEESYSFVLLVDEAHNLPDRANEMFSADISYTQLSDVTKIKSVLGTDTKSALDRLEEYFSSLRSIMEQPDKKETGIDPSITPQDSYISHHTCAARKIPKEIVKILSLFVTAARNDLDRIKNRANKKILKDFYFAARFFVKVAEEYFDASYILLIEKDARHMTISLRCLNSSRFLSQFNTGKHAGIYFSATLNPQDYFANLLSDPSAARNLSRISYPSPFPPQNLMVGLITNVSVKYSNRMNTLNDIVLFIRTSVSCKKGNYIVFSPSFDYMDRLVGLFTAQSVQDTIMVQKRNMSPQEKDVFLSAFQSVQTHSLIGFAVLGGIFGEGIDLVGDCLSGVLIIGVGLPQKSVCQEILKDYYTSVFGNGYDYAYRYPGFNKVLQASGRVIRSDTDRGFVILIDERYDLPEYRDLFPDEWQPKHFSDSQELRCGISDFFNS